MQITTEINSGRCEREKRELAVKVMERSDEKYRGEVESPGGEQKRDREMNFNSMLLTNHVC